MGKRNLKSEEDLSHADAEQIREIVNQQLRQHDNIKYIEKLCNEVCETHYLKRIYSFVKYIGCAILGGIITFAIQKCFF